MANFVKVAVVQSDVVFAGNNENLERMESQLRETATQGAQLTVFPECAVTGYCFDSKDEALAVAETIPGTATEHMFEHCRQLGVYCVFGLAERSDNKLFNACVLIGPQGLIGHYRKVHLPYLGLDRFATPGDRQFAVHEFQGTRIGMNICYDAAFPEAARVLTLSQAELIVLPTNWPPGSELAAAHLINARALENRIYYLAANRVGTERGFRFIGQSRICGPDGETLALADHAKEEILYSKIDPALARNKRIVRVPGRHEIDRIKDRRPDFYVALAGSEPLKDS